MASTSMDIASIPQLVTTTQPFRRRPSGFAMLNLAMHRLPNRSLDQGGMSTVLYMKAYGTFEPQFSGVGDKGADHRRKSLTNPIFVES